MPRVGKIPEKLKWLPTPECSNYHTSALISHVSVGKSFLKILQAVSIGTWTRHVQAGLWKGRTRYIHLDSRRSKRIQKSICFIDYTEVFHCVQFKLKGVQLCDPMDCSTPGLEEKGSTRPTLLGSWDTCGRRRSNSQNQIWNNGQAQNWGKTDRLYNVTPAYLTSRYIMLNTGLGDLTSWNQDSREK